MELLEGDMEDSRKWEVINETIKVRETVLEEGKEEQEEKVINEEDIWETVIRMKKGKAAGMDEIPMEAWWYGGKAVKEGLVEVIKQVWCKGIMPLDWRTGVVPIFKKGDPKEVGNYREISLLCTAYKIYAEVLRSRLEEECERKEIIPESQGGFRRSRGTIDNIFVLSHLIEREKKKKDGKVFAVFVDIKAAFDKVDRKRLWEIMKENE